MGVLNAQNPDLKAAGIGGSNWQGGGIITINGGKVTAKGSDNREGGGGAGIGGGDCSPGGIVTINGGIVTATGGNGGMECSGGAGIGGGGVDRHDWTGGTGAKVTINGGTVIATGGVGAGSAKSGAGIGSGGSGNNAGPGEPGTFITSKDGGAVIIASSISDQSGKDTWSGMIFEGTDDGKVYGDPTLTTDATIPENKTLVIEDGHTLTIHEGVTLTNQGTITNNGTIINNGNLAGNAISGPGTVHTHTLAAAWSSDATCHWHECTDADCPAANNSQKGGYATHIPGNWIVDTQPTSSAAGQQHKECTVCGYTIQTETIPATGGGSSDGGSSDRDSGTSTYKPDVSKPSQGGGTPSVSPSRPERGDTVTITPKPEEGYEVGKITVTDRNGKIVEVIKNADGTYSFTQPNGRVKVAVSYQPVQTAETPVETPAETPWRNPFGDVAEGDPYYEAVRFVRERGLMSGYSDGKFGPKDDLSRAQLSQILFNQEGRPGVNYLLTFSDVAGEAWYTEAVRWAASQGVVGGYGNGTFGPDDPITREQLAVMLYRYSGSPAPSGTATDFGDADKASDCALDALRWAVGQGIIQGKGGGILDPQGQTTRAEVATMLMRLLQRET